MSERQSYDEDVELALRELRRFRLAPEPELHCAVWAWLLGWRPESEDDVQAWRERNFGLRALCPC